VLIPVHEWLRDARAGFVEVGSGCGHGAADRLHHLAIFCSPGILSRGREGSHPYSVGPDAPGNYVKCLRKSRAGLS